MTVKIRVMEEADIDQADRVLRLAFGRVSGFMPQIHLQCAVEPESLWVAEDQGRIVGTVSAVVFPQLAYIGLMSVDPEFQGRGIGRMLMGRALEAIDRQGCAVTLLDATDKGAPLYESLDFIDDSTAYVFEREILRGDSRSAEGIEAASQRDLEQIIALDAPIFGSDRGKLLRAVWHEGAGQCFVKRDPNGELQGYLFARERSFGPWVALDMDVAGELLLAALSFNFKQAPTVLVPRSNDLCRQLLTDHGFVERRRLRHMRRGGNSPAGRPMQLFAQASFAHG